MTVFVLYIFHLKLLQAFKFGALAPQNPPEGLFFYFRPFFASCLKNALKRLSGRHKAKSVKGVGLKIAECLRRRRRNRHFSTGKRSVP